MQNIKVIKNKHYILKKLKYFFPGKCKFENLYVLFLDHFQAASYGDELFSSLVMVPLAQKYDNKWRRRVWSDHVSALRFLDCKEELVSFINSILI